MTVMFTRGENPLKADKLNTAFSERVLRSGDTMQGMFTLWRDPVNAFDAATKQYVDTRVAAGGSPPPGGSYLPISGGTVTGNLTVNGQMNHVGPVWSLFSGVVASGGIRPYTQDLAYSGTSTDFPTIINLFQAHGDTISNANGVDFFRIGHTFGGPTVNGTRNTFVAVSELATRTGAVVGGPVDYTTGAFYFNAVANNGGSGLSLGAVSGAVFSFNTVMHFFPGATFYDGGVGYELDMLWETGSSGRNKIGMNIVSLSGDNVAGGTNDVMLSLSAAYTQGAGASTRDGILFGLHSDSYFPMAALGTMINTDTASGTMLAKIGVDFSKVTFSEAFLKSQGFAVDGNGRATIRLDNAANDAAAATAGTGINQLYRNGNALQVRLV